MKLEKGQKLLVLRYNTKAEPNCIALHEKVIQQLGFCWFGKIGKIPSAWMLEAVFSEKTPAIILYNRSGSYLAELKDFSYDTQYDGIPDYYNEMLYSKGVFPESYYKLNSIERINDQLFERLIVFSSNKSMKDTLSGRAMSSFFFVGYENTSSIPDKQIKSKRFSPIRQEQTVCKYIKNGICRNRKSINYQYECERPGVCICRSE